MMADAPLDPAEYPGMPRWVKVSAIIALVVVLLLVLVLIFGPGDHGPGRHASAM